ncbi:GntR family transcriptional regulator [Actinopolymorpha alba]|uniref:GntR family transcriptional regulator n=1 Tax=Actinopolymorpha alba TaxID=533267 RepID=UPI0003754484|nr:GntR family transcriptional regulator [Actinopolymorpha alba]
MPLPPSAPAQLPMSWRKQDWAYLRLREWILAGRLAPQQTLDQEGLATELGISRVPLRQALVRLAAEGLVVDRPHQRWMITPVSLADARDVYAGREAMEVLLGGAAVEAVTDKDLDELVEIVEEQRWVTERGDLARFALLDRQFHSAIYGLAQMPHSLEVLERLRTLSDRYIAMYLSDLDRATTSLREHAAMIDALRARDADRMRAVTRDHVRGGITALNRLLPELQGRTEDQKRPDPSA